MLGSAGFAELERFLEPVLTLARRSSLSQLLLKLTAPGVPDMYQGSELWEEHLVDPDNRRPVNFSSLQRSLARVRQLTHDQALREADSSMVKLWLAERVLKLRHAAPDWFVGPNASYAPLAVDGQFADHVVAFARSDRVVTVAPRLLRRVPDGLLHTHLQLPNPGSWRDVLTGRVFASPRVECAELLRQFPVALLVRIEA
jgi:(1->4)-alpha-D-glucan 1-alpha-D-glucosylmutase